jgi:hypothetical protein
MNVILFYRMDEVLLYNGCYFNIFVNDNSIEITDISSEYFFAKLMYDMSSFEDKIEYFKQGIDTVEVGENGYQLCPRSGYTDLTKSIIIKANKKLRNLKIDEILRL